MNTKRIEKTLELLPILALKGHAHQNELAKLARLSSLTVLGQLRFLENAGLVSAVRTEPNSKQQKEEQIWSLTFLGLLQVLSTDNLTESDFDQMAKIYKEKWLIFHEWAYLSQDKETKEFIINNTRSYADLKRPWNNLSNAKEFATHTQKSKDAQNEFHRFIVQLKEAEATLAALMLEDIFTLGSIPSNIIERRNENDVLIKLWKRAIMNPSLLKFIKDQFEYEDNKHKAIKDFQNWLLERKTPEKTP